MINNLAGITISNSYPHQTLASIAVSNVDTRGIELSPTDMGNLLRLQLDKTGLFNIVDRYDMTDLLNIAELDITNCYGKSCLVRMGKALNVDKILTGSVERMGDKIVITLRLINVETETIERTDITEYQNIVDELHIMTEISVNNILGLESDPHHVELLVNFEEPISSVYTSQRFGAAAFYTLGSFHEWFQVRER